MKNFFRIVVSLLFISATGVLFPSKGNAQSSVPKPEEHFGFMPGSDCNLFNYEELIDYLVKLDNSSPMVKLVEAGRTPMGRKMYILFISSEENIKKLDRLKEINRELAINPDLSLSEQLQYVDEGRVFFLATLSMHSTEVAPTQALPLIAYELATTDDQQIRKHLEDVVYMAVPNHNPDGMDMVVDNYKKYRGTKYEGASLPQVYHKYVGHDNNRDFIGLTQEDTRAVANIYNLDWYPQVMVEKHQMGSTGIRYFVPPSHDPIAENVDAELWTWESIFGTNMLRDLTAEGLAGVGQKILFDDYWPGATTTCVWKNVIGMLTEAASVKEATPIYIEPSELQASGKGLSEYKKSINFPLPWEGGWWRLNDIIKLERASTLSIIKTASLHKTEILKFRNDLCKREVEKGRTEPPYYYVIPAKQHDQSEFYELVSLMKDHGIGASVMSDDYILNGKVLKKGDVVYSMSQPFRVFLKEVMEKQVFPERHYTPDGELIRPYDITSWSLPLHRGVLSYEIIVRDTLFEALLRPLPDDFGPANSVTGYPVILPVTSNGSYKAAFTALRNGATVERLTQEAEINGIQYAKGSFVITGKDTGLLDRIIKASLAEPQSVADPGSLKLSSVSVPRIALVETYFNDIDAGWTRYLFDLYTIPYTVLHPDDFEKRDLEKLYDLIILPSATKQVLMNGKPGSESNPAMSNNHPDFSKGMGKKGLEKLLIYINNGGRVISWGQSADLFTGLLEINSDKEKEEFTLPFSNIAEKAGKEGLFIPGSLLRVKLVPDHPLTYGMPAEVGIFYRRAPLFTTSIPRFDMDRRVIGTFAEKEIIISGYGEKEEMVAEKPALLWIKKGKGELILYSFNPPFRASTHSTYKLLFNAILSE